MKIERPYIDLFWKKDIFKIVNKKNIPYVEDSTNLEDIFERNKIRKKLNNKTLIEKQSIYKWFIMSNKILKKKFKKVDNLYKNWKKYEFDLKLFRKIKYKDELVFIFVNENFKNVKLSSKKISNLTKFFKSETGGKNFKLNDKNFISKKNSKIIFF
jgi:tRNA(Ile)-lysidine synthase